MNHLNAVLASAHQEELERQAGCCTPGAEHQRATHLSLRERLAARRKTTSPPQICCA